MHDAVHNLPVETMFEALLSASTYHIDMQKSLLYWKQTYASFGEVTK